MADPVLPTHKNKLHVALDLRIVVALLLVVIAVMLLIWKPWSSSTSDRTVQITGEATVAATPDEFVFYPSYQFKNADKDAALAAVTKKSDEVVAKLKALGVDDSNIKTNSSGYDYPLPTERTAEESIYTLQITVTVASIEDAQKVQDYLVTTTPTGSVSPQPSFSDKKRKELEDKARNQATQDARKKVDQMGKNLDFKVGKVKSVTDGSGFGDVIPLARENLAIDGSTAASKLMVLPGENDLHYSVMIVYFIR
jgi:uncharacterized protein